MASSSDAAAAMSGVSHDEEGCDMGLVPADRAHHGRAHHYCAVAIGRGSFIFGATIAGDSDDHAHVHADRHADDHTDRHGGHFRHDRGRDADGHRGIIVDADTNRHTYRDTDAHAGPAWDADGHRANGNDVDTDADLHRDTDTDARPGRHLDRTGTADRDGYLDANGHAVAGCDRHNRGGHLDGPRSDPH